LGAYFAFRANDGTIRNDHIAERGCDLLRFSRERDFEGIVGKRTCGTYQTDGRSTSSVKIENPAYSQTIGRSELFEQRRSKTKPRASQRAGLRFA
jgi:ATP-dependent DNA ligase